MRALLLALALVTCSSAAFAQDSAGPGWLPLGKSAGAGSSIGIGDGRYLKLDASNDPLTGALTITNGAVAAPALNFTSDVTTGMWRTSANNIAWSKAGVEVGELTSAGWQSGFGAVATPAFSSFSDTNSGLYWIAGDDLGFATNATLRLEISTTAITSTLPFLGPSPGSTTPTYSASADSDTGLSFTGAGFANMVTNGSATTTWGPSSTTTTQVFLGPNGAVGAPTFSFANDPDTGMFGSGTGILHLATNGAAGLSITSSQNVSFFGVLGGGALGNAPAVADAVNGYNLLSTPNTNATDCDAGGEAGRISQNTSSTHSLLHNCPGAAGWVARSAGGLTHDSDAIARSSTLEHGGTFLLISGTAYFVYMGEATSFGNTEKFCKFNVTTAGAGAQTAEVGIFSSPLPPNGTNQSMTKIVSTATVDALTGTGVKANTTSFATSVTPGTYVWCGIRTAMATTQPTIEGVSGDDSTGSILTLAGSGALTGAGPFAATIPALATVGTNVGPELRLWH